MTTATVFFWMTGRNVSATRVFPIRFSVNGFAGAVLPLDEPLETALLFREELKRCVVCGQPFLPGSNRAKYCKLCAAKVHCRQKTASDRKKAGTMRTIRSEKTLHLLMLRATVSEYEG